MLDNVFPIFHRPVIDDKSMAFRVPPVCCTVVRQVQPIINFDSKITGILNQGNVQVQTGTNTPYTAVHGDVVFGETSNGGGGTIQVTLPASPSGGDTVTVMDASLSGGFASNNCTVDRNGSPIQGAASDLTLSTNNQAVTLVYTNSTKGWQKQSTNSQEQLDAH